MVLPVWMWEMDHKEGWAPKNWCFWIVVLEKTLESPLDCMEIKPVNPKGDQPWIFNGKTDAKAEAPIFWPLDTKNRLTGKDPDAGEDWGQEEKEMTEDEVVGWHRRLNGHESQQAPGNGEGQGSLTCYSPGGAKSQTWLSEQQQQFWLQSGERDESLWLWSLWQQMLYFYGISYLCLNLPNWKGKERKISSFLC